MKAMRTGTEPRWQRADMVTRTAISSATSTRAAATGARSDKSTDFLLKEVAKFAFAQTCLPVEAMLERPMQRRRVALNIDAAPHYQDKRDEA